MDITSSPSRFHDEISDEELRQILHEARDAAVSRAAQARLALDQHIKEETIAAKALAKTLFA